MAVADCLRFERESFDTLHQMLSGPSESEQEAARQEIEEALGEFETTGRFVGPCELVVAVGTK